MATVRKHYDKWQSIVSVMGHPAIYKTFQSKTDATRWSNLPEVKLRRDDSGIIDYNLNPILQFGFGALIFYYYVILFKFIYYLNYA